MKKYPVEFPIDGVLDLHTFRPEEVKDLVPEYLSACREQGILQVRVIHGKGTGSLRRTLQSILEKLPCVESFHTAEETGGGWGATIVILKNGREKPFDKETCEKKCLSMKPQASYPAFSKQIISIDPCPGNLTVLRLSFLLFSRLFFRRRHREAFADISPDPSRLAGAQFDRAPQGAGDDCGS